MNKQGTTFALTNPAFGTEYKLYVRYESVEHKMINAHVCDQHEPNPIPERGNVLVIEDDPDTTEMLVITLSMAGYAVRAVDSRDAAAEAIHRNLYRFVLLDFNMQGMTPEAFIEEARRTAPRAEIVLMTAECDVANRAQQLSLRYWLGKPFTPEALFHVLDEI